MPTSNYTFVATEDILDLVAEWTRDADETLAIADALPATAEWHLKKRAEERRRQEEAEAEAAKKARLIEARSRNAGMPRGGRQQQQTPAAASSSPSPSPSTARSPTPLAQTAESRLVSAEEEATAAALADLIAADPEAYADIVDGHANLGAAADSRRAAALSAADAYDVFAKESLKVFSDRLEGQMRQLEAVGHVAAKQQANRGY